MATYWENSCSFGLRYVSWYKYLIVSLVFSHLGFWSGNLFLIAPFPDLCLLVPLHKVNVVESDKCQCGAIETVSHYLLACPQYDKEREIMRKRLFEMCGIIHLDLNILLDARNDDEYKDWRSNISCELEAFVAKTQRFAVTRPKNH